MIEFRKAYDLVLENCKVLGVEEVKIEDSARRILAENVRSDTDMPPFDKSAMDGYAVKWTDTVKTPALLNVCSMIKAGFVPRGEVKKGTAAAIMTGAPVPRGADAVVKVEDTEQAGRGSIKINSPIKKGKNICKKGEDIKKGKIVLNKGKEIEAAEIATMALVGKKCVKVYRLPRVSILATGDELVPHSRPMKKGCIRNSNSPMLTSLFNTIGIKAIDLGVAGDKRGELEKKIKRGLKSDILVLSGGVSMGQYDLVPEVSRACGVKKIFHKVAMKPGKPVFFGKKGHTLIFGAPGNPVSVLALFLLLIKPAVKRICAAKFSVKPLKGVLSKTFATSGGRRTHYPVRIKFEEGRYKLSLVNYHGSANISALTEADGFMIVERGIKRVAKGAEVDFFHIR